MPKTLSQPKSPPSGARAKRDAKSGKFVGVIGDKDARLFGTASSKLIRKVTGSRAQAVKILKASGYLTSSGKVAKRYK